MTMVFYDFLTNRFTRPEIEKHQARGFGKGLAKTLVDISADIGEQDFTSRRAAFFANALAGEFAKDLDRVRNEGDKGNAIRRARGYAEGFASGFTVAMRESEREGISPYQTAFLSQCLAGAQAKSRAEGVADAFDKGLAEGEKRAAKQHSANSRHQ